MRYHKIMLLVIIISITLIMQPTKAVLPESLKFSYELREETEFDYFINTTHYSSESYNIFFQYTFLVNIRLIQNMGGIEYIDFEFPLTVSDYVIVTENGSETNPAKYFTHSGNGIEWLIMPTIANTSNFFEISANEGSDYFEEENSNYDPSTDEFHYFVQNEATSDFLDYTYDSSSGILLSGISRLSDGSSVAEKHIILEGVNNFFFTEVEDTTTNRGDNTRNEKLDGSDQPLFTVPFPALYLTILMIVLIRKQIKL